MLPVSASFSTSVGELQGGCAKSGSDCAIDTPRILRSGLSAPQGG